MSRLPNGGRRLIGADFLVFAETWHASNTATPELGGQLMHLIESPNRYGLPAFYTLHVWAWKPNPTGAFVNWHSDVSCEQFDGQQAVIKSAAARSALLMARSFDPLSTSFGKPEAFCSSS